MATLEEYIRYAAAQRGIDPDIAVRVAKSEGGLNDPVRQSLVKKNGRQEPSYGPFQLLVGGGDTGFPAGLGNDFMQATGKDPRNPSHAQAAIDFALDTAARDGWGRWYGAKAAGLDKFAGIGGRPAGNQGPAPSLYAGMADGPKGQEMYPRSSPGPVPGAMIASAPASSASPPTPIPAAAQALAGGSGNKMADIFGMMALAPQQQPQFSPVQIMGPSGEQANALSSLVAALKGRMA
ncbi:hypothetical protein ACLMJV_17145 [Sinorhizobium meliloti]|uniref:hypothetical protein n=1 Tax=Rhizobium meliloti TaxID=382 RepID=UPI00398CA115